MQAIARALGDPVVRGWYLAFSFALMVLPMVAMSAWYHVVIRRTEGGRALMKRNSQAGIVEAGGMARDIATGKYGAEVKTIQGRTYVIVAVWLLANALAFGVLAWADEVNRPAP